MSASALKEALNNCLINFDRRVLVTDLLEEYELRYQDVHETLSEHLTAQEKKGNKYEKRFLVRGVEHNSTNQVFTVVQGDSKLQEWLQKLKNAESSLYSVELDGGAKAPAQIFTPVRRCAIELSSLKVRAGSAKMNGVSSSAKTPACVVKVETKPEVKKPTGMNAFAKKPKTDASTSEAAASVEKSERTSTSTIITSENKPDVKKSAEKSKQASAETKETSPTEEKKKIEKSTSKKGIKNAKDAKTAGAVKPPTPKKMQDFFKKQTVKPPAPIRDNKKTANTSVQLFSEDEEGAQIDSDSSSSDEEEKLAALKRDIISSDHEDEADGDADVASTSAVLKRRRILDSDDDEPLQKHDKKADDNAIISVDENEGESEATALSETFMDDDGFVTTIKLKKSNIVRKPTKPLSPKKRANGPKKEPVAKSKTKPAAATKTKQGNIMSFFSKK